MENRTNVKHITLMSFCVYSCFVFSFFCRRSVEKVKTKINRNIKTLVKIGGAYEFISVSSFHIYTQITRMKKKFDTQANFFLLKKVNFK